MPRIVQSFNISSTILNEIPGTSEAQVFQKISIWFSIKLFLFHLIEFPIKIYWLSGLECVFFYFDLLTQLNFNSNENMLLNVLNFVVCFIKKENTASGTKSHVKQKKIVFNFILTMLIFTMWHERAYGARLYVDVKSAQYRSIAHVFHRSRHSYTINFRFRYLCFPFYLSFVICCGRTWTKYKTVR